MRFIKLTSTSNDKAEFWLNADLIEAFHKSGDNTMIWTLGSEYDDAFLARETPEEILSILGQSTVADCVKAAADKKQIYKGDDGR